MKKFALITLSIFTMLVSCKCKKAVTNEVAVSEVQNTTLMSNLDSAKTTIVAENTISDVQQSKNIIEYNANTRGYHLKVKWDGSQLSYTNQRDSKDLDKVSLSKAQSDELNAMVKKLPLEMLGSLKAPTQKRLYDGAAHADMKVVIDGKEYNSAGFDHGFPPAEIEKLVKKLVSYTEQK